jgi:N-acetylglucosamine repressor
MKRNNQLRILRTIRALGPVSRVRLQKETNLSWGTITTSTKELIEREILKEVGSVITGVGRRPVELDMNTDRNHAVGVRLGGSYIRSVVLDVKGTVVGDYKGNVDPEASTEVILGQLFSSVENALSVARVGRDRVAGIGVAAPGALDADAGVCLYAPHHPQWKNVELKRRFEERFGEPCFLDHVNNCSALGHLWFGLGKGLRNFLCVLLGTGISAGIIVDGQVYRGVNCAAGEFGHVCIDPNGPQCACGCTGCLEAFASGPALAQSATRVVRDDPKSALRSLAHGKPEAISAETVFLAAEGGDPEAKQIFERMGFYLGIGISNLINLFNPERIILGGRVSQAHRYFMPALERTIAERAWHISKQEIKISTLANEAVLGAAGIVLQHLYDTGLVLPAVCTSLQERAVGV